jgi:hypothetical protein
MPSAVAIQTGRLEWFTQGHQDAMRNHLYGPAREPGRTVLVLTAALVVLSGMFATNAIAAPGGSKGDANSERDRGRREAPAQSADRGRSGTAPGRTGEAPPTSSAQRSANGAGAPRSEATPKGADSRKGEAGRNQNQGVANSGTIKIASLGSDTHPEDEPHPGCAFRVDFYGFREGWLTTEVSLQPPSGRQFLDSARVHISEDGRGNEYQTSIAFDMMERLRAIDGQAERFHILVDARRDDARGNGSKTKVLWLECPASDDSVAEAEGTALSSRTGAAAVPEIPLVLANGTLPTPLPPFAVAGLVGSAADGTEQRVAASGDDDRTVSAAGAGGLALTGTVGSLILLSIILMAIGALLRRSETT